MADDQPLIGTDGWIFCHFEVAEPFPLQVEMYLNNVYAVMINETVQFWKLLLQMQIGLVNF